MKSVNAQYGHELLIGFTQKMSHVAREAKRDMRFPLIVSRWRRWVPSDPQWCAISDCARLEYPGIIAIVTLKNVVYVHEPLGWFRYMLDSDDRDKIDALDTKGVRSLLTLLRRNHGNGTFITLRAPRSTETRAYQTEHYHKNNPWPTTHATKPLRKKSRATIPDWRRLHRASQALVKPINAGVQ